MVAGATMASNAETARAAFENTGSGWVQHDVTPSAHSTIASFKFFDINDDHKLDLYQQGYTWTDGYKTEVFLNNGDKTFTPTTNEFTQHGYEIQSRYDVDMDNDLGYLSRRSREWRCQEVPTKQWQWLYGRVYSRP